NIADQKPTSWNKVRSRLRTFFEFCSRRGWVDQDLLIDIRPKRVVREQRLQLTAGELQQLLGVPDPRERALISVAMNTGLRASTITSLRVKDVDLQSGSLHVVVTKSAYEDQLPITSDLDRELGSWLITYAQEIGRPLAPDDYLVPSRGLRRNRMIDGRWTGSWGDLEPNVRIVHAAAIIKRALERQLGITTVKGEGIHTVRRSVARIVFEQASSQGHDGALRVAAALLGHSSTAATEIYLGVSADRRKRDDLMRGRSLFPDDANVVRLLDHRFAAEA
ncbi:MAG TPA: tyrosine-type recombinase/integrase, partial [Cellulomonadaceae bacterium]|nr:tyrosine-type recombinase/integrase [Cellulomonadaceae bacterium]